MASIVLGHMGSAVGGQLAGPIGQAAGMYMGRLLGGSLDEAIFGKPRANSQAVQGHGIGDLLVQSSAYGKMVPVVWGTVRLAGNIIWARPLKETVVTSSYYQPSQGGKGGGGKATQQQQSHYVYSATLAIALCEGPIDAVLKVWADAKLVYPANEASYVQLYKGTEEQLPDPVMESYEGMGNVPAYRGLAYMVLQDFPLADYGNRIPNFTFEVVRKPLPSISLTKPVEERIRSMVLVPGSGEAVYDPVVQYKVPGEEVGGKWVQQGSRSRVNQHHSDGRADVEVALEQLSNTCPGLEWVAVVVTWFADSLDAAQCSIYPAVEFKEGATLWPDPWQVASFNRQSARVIQRDKEGYPLYGGTPGDSSVVRLLTRLREMGKKVALYPMFFLDSQDKPWRGHVTGSAEAVSGFFTKPEGYGRFIRHYITLAQGKVDAFFIGSELKGLTAVRDAMGQFPAVEALIPIAREAKRILGEAVTVTYAADWSEYHHTEGGWYALDPLWACEAIDVVGIDAYFPLTDSLTPVYDKAMVREGWFKGEGMEWYYADGERKEKHPLQPAYAWKNIAWWWEQPHYNPDGRQTPWAPRSKPIWFTEFGFPSVDAAANQPSIFFHPESRDGGVPYHSRGYTDIRAQRVALEAALDAWEGSPMVTNMFAWCWDARPFPLWPGLSRVWRDSGLWQKGHWLQGKLGLSSLAAMVHELCDKAGMPMAYVDVSRLEAVVHGMVITNPVTIKALLETLGQAFFFIGMESQGGITFLPLGAMPCMTVGIQDRVTEKSETENGYQKIRGHRGMLPHSVSVLFMQKEADYQPGNQYAMRYTGEGKEGQEILSLPIVLDAGEARAIAEKVLFARWMEHTRVTLRLPFPYIILEPGDSIDVKEENQCFPIRIQETRLVTHGVVEIEGVTEDASIYHITKEGYHGQSVIQETLPAGESYIAVLDLPALPFDKEGEGYVRLVVAGYEKGWRGAVAAYARDGVHFEQGVMVTEAAVIGHVVVPPAQGVTSVIDRENHCTVAILGEGTLENIEETALMDGRHYALIGGEIIQFANARLVSPGKYILSGLLRGRQGTEDAMDQHVPGEFFVLLDARTLSLPMPLAMRGIPYHYRATSIGQSTEDAKDITMVWQARSLQPLAPVHFTVQPYEGEGGGWILRWHRRSRIHGEWQDEVDVPLEEEKESYRLEISHAGKKVRVIDGIPQPWYIYEEAVYRQDFPVVPIEVTFAVCQMSARVGKGKVREVVVEGRI